MSAIPQWSNEETGKFEKNIHQNWKIRLRIAHNRKDVDNNDTKIDEKTKRGTETETAQMTSYIREKLKILDEKLKKNPGHKR